MTTISQLVKRIIDTRPVYQELLIEGVANYSNLAEKLQPRIEADLGEEVNTSAVIMALRRYGEKLQKKSSIPRAFSFSSEIIMKTNLCDITIVKTHTALEKITEVYKLVDYEKGETLNIIQGNHEITIVLSQKQLKKIKDIFRKEKIVNTETDLVSLTLGLPKEFLYTPGILSFATRKLAWENINIYENISTMTELIFIIAEKDAVKGYNTFQEIIRDYTKESVK